jgi:predicted hydrocarbon binding protein
MKGVIFNILEEFIVENWGQSVLEEAFESLPLKTKEPFVAPGSYPDEDFTLMVGFVVKLTNKDVSLVLQEFGRFAIPKFAQRYPIFFDGYDNPKTFLMTIDTVHFEEVAKLYKDVTPPRFAFEDVAPNRLILTYSSKRQLCNFMKGLIDGVGDYFQMPIDRKELKCTLKGDDCCDFYLTFSEPV